VPFLLGVEGIIDGLCGVCKKPAVGLYVLNISPDDFYDIGQDLFIGITYTQ
jgi:hypothetical protein